MEMAELYTRAFVIWLLVFINFAHSLKYGDLESLGIACPRRDKCRGYKNDLPFSDRNCQCDSACHKYQDCCIDVRKRSSGQRTPATNVMCLHYGQNPHSGIYVVSKCSNDWSGPNEVKQHCEGATDFSDPVTAAPVTSTFESVTYKNLYCAQCNNADMNSLKAFQFILTCEDLNDLSQEQIMDQISYNKEKNKWGINRSNANGKSEFKECEIFFDLPSYLQKNVRFCRANIVSKCAQDWTRHQVRISCEEYMAVVYSRTRAYRNPHCAICNHVTIADLSCNPDQFGKKTPLPLSVLIDINEKSNNKPSCPSNNIYDSYFKKCRQLSCALPGYVIKSGKCVPGG